MRTLKVLDATIYALTCLLGFTIGCGAMLSYKDAPKGPIAAVAVFSCDDTYAGTVLVMGNGDLHDVSADDAPVEELQKLFEALGDHVGRVDVCPEGPDPAENNLDKAIR